VYLDDKVRVEYVNEAFELQMQTLKRPERDNIDLNPEVPDEAPAADQEQPAGDAEDADTAQRRPRRMKITYADYERIGKMLAKHLAQEEDAQRDVREDDLVAWYMEKMEEEITTEAQLFEHQHLVQLIINRLIDKDRVIVVARPSEDPLRPEGRVLVKHPNFPIGESITRT